jgi:hypothetical protein
MESNPQKKKRYDRSIEKLNGRGRSQAYQYGRINARALKT